MVPPDFTLSLSQDNGSVPPCHRRSTRHTLGTDGRLCVVRIQGYNGPTETTELTLDAGRICALLGELDRLGLFTTRWQPPERRAIGGGQSRLTVTRRGETADLPPEVSLEQREARRRILDAVRASLSSEL